MKLALLTALLAIISAPALACEAHEKANAHAGHTDHAPAQMSTAPSTKAYQKAMDVMHKDMMVGYTGDADVDFVKGMIPHHQGAVDMAEIQLKYGKDPEIRKLAQEVIKAQKTEIKFMQDWLKAHKAH